MKSRQGESKVAELEATIGVTSLHSQVGQLGREIATDAVLEAAGETHTKEASDSTALEKGLTEGIDSLRSAAGLLQRHAVHV